MQALFDQLRNVVSSLPQPIESQRRVSAQIGADVSIISLEITHAATGGLIANGLLEHIRRQGVGLCPLEVGIDIRPQRAEMRCHHRSEERRVGKECRDTEWRRVWRERLTV